MRERNKKEGFS